MEPGRGIKAQSQIYRHSVFHKLRSLLSPTIPCVHHRLTSPSKPRTFIKRDDENAKEWGAFLICHGAVFKVVWGGDLFQCNDSGFFMFSSHSLRWNAHFIKVMEGCCSIYSPHECKVAFASLKTFSEIWMLNYKALVRAELGRSLNSTLPVSLSAGQGSWNFPKINCLLPELVDHLRLSVVLLVLLCCLSVLWCL